MIIISLKISFSKQKPYYWSLTLFLFDVVVIRKLMVKRSQNGIYYFLPNKMII